ncbi:MAG: type II secretion system F family protein [Planctomycetota bacterium]
MTQDSFAVPTPSGNQAQEQPLHPGTLRYEDLALFNFQLAEMVRAQVPLPEAFRQISSEIRSKLFRRILEEMQKSLTDGMSFSSALQPHRKHFPSLYLGIIEAGIAGGNLADLLESFAQYAQTKISLKHKIREATTYPLLTLSLMLPIFLLLLHFVGPLYIDFYQDYIMFGMPHLEQSYQEQRSFQIYQTLTVPMRKMVAYRNELTLSLGILLLSLVIFLVLTKKNSAWHQQKNRWLLRIPFYGPIFHGISLSLILRNIAILLQGGTSLSNTLALTVSSLEDPLAQHHLKKLLQGIQEGEKFSSALEKVDYFPPYISWLLAKDEGNPHFIQTLNHLADYYQNRSERRMENLKLLILPLAEIFLGLFVLLSALLFLLPLNLLSISIF